jgi:flagellum-specific ATP synthase
LVQIGAYAHGSDPGLDEAIVLHDGMGNFLQQDMFEAASFESTLESMEMATQRNV